jgi:hypothetical protein
VRDILRKIVEEYGAIASVTACSDFTFADSDLASRFEEYELEFERGVLTIGANAENDTIQLTEAPSLLPHKSLVSSSEPWRSVVGYQVLWTWLLENQGKFTDGFQFECRTSDGFVDVQLMCEASALSVRTLVKI